MASKRAINVLLVALHPVRHADPVWFALERVGARVRLPAAGTTVALFSEAPHELVAWIRAFRLRALRPVVPPGLPRGGQELLGGVGLRPGAKNRGNGPEIEELR
jgi:hypothetical protein